MFERYTKPEDEPLVSYECVQLLFLLVENGIVQRDPDNPDNILVWLESDGIIPEGWYSRNLFEAAGDLAYDKEGQQFLLGELASHNIPVVFKNWLETKDHLTRAAFVKEAPNGTEERSVR